MKAAAVGFWPVLSAALVALWLPAAAFATWGDSDTPTGSGDTDTDTRTETGDSGSGPTDTDTDAGGDTDTDVGTPVLDSGFPGNEWAASLAGDRGGTSCGSEGCASAAVPASAPLALLALGLLARRRS